jgi:hypothetical protein
MKNWKNLLLPMLTIGALCLTSCLHIIEDVTFTKNGSGTYKMTIDMSEMKSMLEMLKSMNPTAGDSTGVTEQGGDNEVTPGADGSQPAEEGGGGNEMSQMGEQLAGNIKSSLTGVPGISNIVEINDTTNLIFGYTFDFANVEALNKAIKIINKEKYDAKAEETFRFSGKKFERLGAANIGEELKKALSQGSEEDESGQMEMMTSMFADMSYQQVYHFPDRTVKKSSNTLTEISDNGHTMSITLKPFSEDEAQKKATVTTEVKLK